MLSMTKIWDFGNKACLVEFGEKSGYRMDTIAAALPGINTIVCFCPFITFYCYFCIDL